MFGTPGTQVFLVGSVKKLGFPFAEVLLNRRNSPGAQWVRGFRALSDFRVRGTREAGERWWGLAGPQQLLNRRNSPGAEWIRGFRASNP